MSEAVANMAPTALPDVTGNAAQAPSTDRHSAPTEAQYLEGLETRRIAVVMGFATTLRWPVTATFFVIALMLWPFVPAPLVLGWLAAVILAREVRAWQLFKLSKDASTSIDHKRRQLMLWDIPLGVSHGSTAFFMVLLPPTYDAMLTMILVSLAAGAVSTSAVVLRLYVIYAVSVFVPTALMWILAGTPLSLGIAALILMFAGVQFRFASQNARVFEESYRIRVENEKLVHELAAARDAAEAANRAKSRFLAVASHDLRQPLHALTLHSGLLAQAPLPSDAPAIATEMSASIESLGTLLDSLLDISKLDAGVVDVQTRPIKLQRLVAHLIRSHRPQALEKGLALSFECPPDAVVVTDPVLLERLLRNLIDNAVKYTQHGEVCVHITPDADGFGVAVRDSGCGIPTESHAKVFEEFYQVDTGGSDRDRTQGLGLGLAIVARLAVLLGLRIELQSQPGQGTVVAFTIARAPAVVVDEPSVVAAPEHGLQGVKVLFIDDEEPVRRAMRNVLSRFGCEAVEAAGSEEALRCIDSFTPQLVVADYRLRHGDSGVSAIARLRQQLPGLPALLISGDTDAERLREAERSGLSLLHKPVSLERLRDAMQAVLQAATPDIGRAG